jgi:hypothetical protein
MLIFITASHATPLPNPNSRRRTQYRCHISSEPVPRFRILFQVDNLLKRPEIDVQAAQ